MSTGGNAPSHGVDATPEINASDNGGTPAAPGAPANPAAPANPGAAAPPANPAAPANPPIGGADGAAADLYKPQGIADHLLGQDDKGTIDKLFKAYEGARTELAKGKPAPVKAADYKFEWSDKLKGAGITSDDPAVKAFSEMAEKAGVSQEQIAIVPQFFDLAVDKGWIDKPFDSGALLTSLAPTEFKGTPEERQAKGAERLTTAENWITQLDPKAHGFSDAMKQELRLLTTSVAGVHVIEKMMNGSTNVSVSTGAGAVPAAVSKSELDARVADPRNQFMDPKYDETFAVETRKMFKQFYPD